MMTRPRSLPRSTRSRLLALLLVALAAASCAGIVFGAWYGSILMVAFAALVPGFCVVAIISAETW